MNTAIRLSAPDECRELAHELRNPLASIMSSVELIQALGPETADVPRLLALVDERTRTMATVIDRFLTGASLNSDTISTEKTEEVVTLSTPGTPASRAATSSESGLRVLIVDDNMTAADSLARLLTLRGYVVETAYGGAAGFEKAQSFLPHAAILDIGMPIVDGYALAGMIRSAAIPCTLIALTGYDRVSERQGASSSTFDFYLKKPTRASDIEQLLRKIPAADAARAQLG